VHSEVINMNFKRRLPNNNKYHKEGILIIVDRQNAGSLFPKTFSSLSDENFVQYDQ
jgi:hypothetical protein